MDSSQSKILNPKLERPSIYFRFQWKLGLVTSSITESGPRWFWIIYPGSAELPMHCATWHLSTLRSPCMWALAYKQSFHIHLSHPLLFCWLSLYSVTVTCHYLSTYTHTQIIVKCMKIVSLWCIWLPLRTKVIGNLFVKELMMGEVNKQPYHTLPMQEIL